MRDDSKEAWVARASALLSLGRELEARNELAQLLNGMYDQKKGRYNVYFTKKRLYDDEKKII